MYRGNSGSRTLEVETTPSTRFQAVSARTGSRNLAADLAAAVFLRCRDQHVCSLQLHNRRDNWSIWTQKNQGLVNPERSFKQLTRGEI